MLINNKSLIKTINKLNLTDDEREKFNKISEDDRGNFVYNGNPVIGGATEEQVAQIQANTTAIGDSNNGLIKEINDIKNTKLPNLNTDIQTLETLIGNKSELPSGDRNIIASIKRIDRKTATEEGLTSEQAQQLTTAYEHSQSTHVQTSDIPTKVSQLYNDSSFVTTAQMNTAISQAQLNGGSISNITYELLDDSLKSLFIIEEVE